MVFFFNCFYYYLTLNPFSERGEYPKDTLTYQRDQVHWIYSKRRIHQHCLGVIFFKKKQVFIYSTHHCVDMLKMDL